TPGIQARSLASQPAPSSLPTSLPSYAPAHQPFATSAPGVRLGASPVVGDLPPLADAPTVPLGPPTAQPLSQPSVLVEEQLAAPQWQLIALTVRQVLAQVGAIAGAAPAMRMFNQALMHTARAKPMLAVVTLDPSGWLVPQPADAMTHYSRFAVADAV